MVIEAKDGLIGSIRNGVGIINAIRGKRTWSPLNGEQIITFQEFESLTNLERDSENINGVSIISRSVEATGDNSINYTEVIVRRYLPPIVDTTPFAGDQINENGRPWHGKIRFTQTQPSESEQVASTPTP